jgi:uncharacterized protein
MDARAQTTDRASEDRAPLAAGAVVVLTVAAALVAYKASASLAALAKARAAGSMAPKVGFFDVAAAPAWLRPLAGAANYFGWVLVALAFGVVLGAAVRAFVPKRWLAVSVGAPGLRGHLVAVFVGAPLMLCSCCVSPIFEGVYERTRRLGPALALLVASPALNPAALALTFLLLPAHLAVARLLVALLLVLGACAVVGVKMEPAGAGAATACALETDSSWSGLGRSFVSSLREVALRSLPAIALGVVLSVLLVSVLPQPAAASGGTAALTVLLVAAVAVPVALPTFAEIPLALALLHAGAPEGAALALLVAGPAVNLPSLFTVRRAVSGRVALATGAAVFALAAAGGLAVQLFTAG